MLFQSAIPGLFSKLNFEIESTANKERKEETTKRISFYHDQQLDRLSEQLDTLFSDPSNMVQVELNIVKKIINNLSQVYREPPSRTVDGTDRDAEIYQTITEQCSLDLKMKQASRYTKLLKTILLRPVWRNDHIDLDLLCGNILDIETGDSPEDLQRILITDYGSSNKIEDIEYSLWTADTFQRLDYRGSILDEQPNPYRVLPFIPVFDYMPTGSQFWLGGGDDIISLQESINMALTDLLFLMRMQAFGVGYVKSSSPGGGSVRVDPGTLIELPTDGEIGFKAQQAEIEQVLAAIDKLVKWACVSNGLSAGSMSTDPTEQSGVAKIVDNKELSELRLDDIALFRSYEKKLFDLMRTVWNVHNPKQKLSEKATLAIDFYDPSPKVSPKEQAETWNMLLEMGIATAVDVIMERNKDLKTREDALSFLMQLQEENRALNIAV